MKIGKKTRAILVIAFIAIYLLITYITLRGQYLEYMELGPQYVEKFFTDVKYKYSIMGATFVILSVCSFIDLNISSDITPRAARPSLVTSGSPFSSFLNVHST